VGGVRAEKRLEGDGDSRNISLFRYEASHQRRHSAGSVDGSNQAREDSQLPRPYGVMYLYDIRYY
jgi:hypothetical protein